MRERTCCFTGHRNIRETDYLTIKTRTKEVVLHLIELGVKYFCAGGARGYDTLAAGIVLEIKKEYPEIELILLLPCPEQTKWWTVEEKEKYEEIMQRADKVVYTSDHYYSGCMHKRNRHLVDNSKYCICYLYKDTGGTVYTVNYAKRSGMSIYNVAK